MDTKLAATEQTKKPRRRLIILLIAASLGFGLFLFAQMDPAEVSRLGPTASDLHSALQPGAWEGASARARRFEADVKELGGEPRVVVESPGYFGVFGRSEKFEARFRNKSFDDVALSRLIKAYGDIPVQLVLENTSVSPKGLGQLHVEAKEWLLGVFDYP